MDKRLLFLGLAIVGLAACQAPQPVTRPEPVTEVVKPDPFVFRIHLEAKSADGVDDSLIQDLQGKNDVLILDPVVQLENSDLEKVEFIKNKTEDVQLSLTLTKAGLKKLNTLAKGKKRKSILFYINGKVYEKMKLDASYKKPVLKMKTLLTADQAEKIKKTIPAELLD